MNAKPEHIAAIQRLGYNETEASFLVPRRHSLRVFHAQPVSTLHPTEQGLPCPSFYYQDSDPGARDGQSIRLPDFGFSSLLAPDLRRDRQGQPAESAAVVEGTHPNQAADSGFRSVRSQPPVPRNRSRQSPLLQPRTWNSTDPDSGRTYKSRKSGSQTDRYFVDRFPIFLTNEPLPTPTFVYCDSDLPGLFGYLTHVRNYEQLLRRLHGFNLVYASPDSAKFRRAQGFFSRTFDSNTPRGYRPTGPVFRHPPTLGESQNRVPDPCRPRLVAGRR